MGESCTANEFEDLVLQAVAQYEGSLKRRLGYQGIFEFLLSHGLGMDPIHVAALARSWSAIRPRSHYDRFSEASGAALSERIQALQERLLEIVPGMKREANVKKAALRGLDKIRLFACGAWVTRKRKGRLDLNPRPSESTLCLDVSTGNSFAYEFTVRRPGGQLGRVVQYGEVVLLVCNEGKVREVKLFAPGKAGAVRIDDHLYIIQTSTQEAPRAAVSAWCLGSVTRRRGTPIQKVSTSSAKVHAGLCFTLRAAEYTPPPDASIPLSASAPRGKRPDVTVSVLLYNTWMLPRLWGVTRTLQSFGMKLSVRKAERAKIIPDALYQALQERVESSDLDVIVLCEAFCDRAGRILKAGLKRRFGVVFETPIGGSGPILQTRTFANGGITILSKYPILEASTMALSSLMTGEDKMANKCAMHVRILKSGLALNIIATHLQAWDYDAAVKARETQMLAIKRMVDDKGISASEPVVLAGDMNICRVRSPMEYARMLEILDANDPHEIDEDTLHLGRTVISLQQKRKSKRYLEAERLVQPDMHRVVETDPRVRNIFTTNSLHNKLADGGPSSGNVCELLDYILLSNAHLAPTTSTTTILSNVTSEKVYRWRKHVYRDLSDHYPLLTKLTFAPVASE